MFIDEKTLNTIHANLGCTISSATLRTEDLVPVFIAAIKDTPEYVQLMNVVPAYAKEDKNSDWWDSDNARFLLDELFDILNAYAPDGYYFGSTDDLSDFGFWKIEDNE